MPKMTEEEYRDFCMRLREEEEKGIWWRDNMWKIHLAIFFFWTMFIALIWFWLGTLYG